MSHVKGRAQVESVSEQGAFNISLDLRGME